MCNISTYWYHDAKEKIVHTTALANFLLKSVSRLTRDHRRFIIKYSMEALRMFGDHKTIAENLNYFLKNVSAYNKYKIDWKCYNILSIAYKHTELGITYDYEY